MSVLVSLGKEVWRDGNSQKGCDAGRVGHALNVPRVRGASSFDLSGTGQTFIATARYTNAVSGPFFVEVGTAFFNYTNQFGW